MKSTRICETLFAIISRDDNIITKRNWQKIVFGFYKKDSPRTFTLNKQYALDFHSYFKVSEQNKLLMLIIL